MNDTHAEYVDADYIQCFQFSRFIHTKILSHSFIFSLSLSFHFILFFGPKKCRCYQWLYIAPTLQPMNQINCSASNAFVRFVFRSLFFRNNNENTRIMPAYFGLRFSFRFLFGLNLNLFFLNTIFVYPPVQQLLRPFVWRKNKIKNFLFCVFCSILLLPLLLLLDLLFSLHNRPVREFHISFCSLRFDCRYLFTFFFDWMWDGFPWRVVFASFVRLHSPITVFARPRKSADLSFSFVSYCYSFRFLWSKEMRNTLIGALVRIQSRKADNLLHYQTASTKRQNLWLNDRY